ncbi:MAG: pyridoxal phosphate-dependent aminotransferase [Gemmataceae bacterium]
MSIDRWLSARAKAIEMSGVRRVFELARSLKSPVDLSIGQPHFPVPQPIKDALKSAVDADKNGYTVTQGVPELRSKLKSWIDEQYHHSDRDVIVTSGTSGGLMLATLATIDPGDEVIVFDPYFVAYLPMVTLNGGVPVVIDTYPDFALDVDKVRQAITPRTKMILFNTPANPTGMVPSRDAVRDLAALADKHGVLLVSDQIYHRFAYDGPATSPAEFLPSTLVVDGFGKTYGITGWRLGFAHGPAVLIDQMAKLQQFSFVCAPSMVQHAGAVACDVDMSREVAAYSLNRDRLVAALQGHYEFTAPGGAFYLFAKCPHGTGTDFATKAIEQNLLLIPGTVFSKRDTHVRISYAVSEETLERGIEILLKLATPNH